VAVFIGEKMIYVPWDAIFPETLPPQEDILYFELYNYFNDLISDDPEWEEVVSENMDDPRDNPAYGERNVMQYGKEVRLVPGTGVYSENGAGAEIDYSDLKWWLEEGFTGTWTLSEEDREWMSKIAQNPDIVKGAGEGNSSKFRNWYLMRGMDLMRGTELFRPTPSVD
jgi:hypothetical protein